MTACCFKQTRKHTGLEMGNFYIFSHGSGQYLLHMHNCTREPARTLLVILRACSESARSLLVTCLSSTKHVFSIVMDNIGYIPVLDTALHMQNSARSLLVILGACSEPARSLLVILGACSEPARYLFEQYKKHVFSIVMDNIGYIPVVDTALHMQNSARSLLVILGACSESARSLLGVCSLCTEHARSLLEACSEFARSLLVILFEQ